MAVFRFGIGRKRERERKKSFADNDYHKYTQSQLLTYTREGREGVLFLSFCCLTALW